MSMVEYLQDNHVTNHVKLFSLVTLVIHFSGFGYMCTLLSIIQFKLSVYKAVET